MIQKNLKDIIEGDIIYDSGDVGENTMSLYCIKKIIPIEYGRKSFEGWHLHVDINNIPPLIKYSFQREFDPIEPVWTLTEEEEDNLTNLGLKMMRMSEVYKASAKNVKRLMDRTLKN